MVLMSPDAGRRQRRQPRSDCRSVPGRVESPPRISPSRVRPRRHRHLLHRHHLRPLAKRILIPVHGKECLLASASGRNKLRPLDFKPYQHQRFGSAVPAQPAEIPPADGCRRRDATPQISDSSLAPLISAAPTPARAASLRITEKQRVELEKGHVDDAVRELAHAISIDPSNSYAYFYLGLAYVARKGYAQALTFFQTRGNRARLKFRVARQIYAFEGLALEQSESPSRLRPRIRRRSQQLPVNLTARVGATRLAAFVPAPVLPAPVADANQPAPSPNAIEAPPPPDVAPPPLPPAPASMPSPAAPTDD